jgi:predicted metal-dependent hydrolase
MRLPSYTVRESQRAKHVNLKISRLGKLEVIVPRGFDQRRIPEILQQKQNWIERATERIETERSRLPYNSLDIPPKQVNLNAINETLQVAYCQPTKLGFKVFEKQGRLTVWADATQVEVCHNLLRQWLMQKAESQLVPWLQQVSQEIELPFLSARVRGQKTLWASCSGRKTISLNYKLLFLPKPLVRYVFVHELCHTVHLNHSRQFWKLVGQYEPEYKQLDKTLNQAQQFVPLWVERSKEEG